MASQATVDSRTGTPHQGKASMLASVSDSSKIKENDSVQRRTQPVQKAWGPGPNPITQRSNTPSQANGNTAKSTPKNNAQDGFGNMDKIVPDHHLGIFSHAMGQQCTIAMKSGETYTGIPTAFKNYKAGTHILFSMVEVGGQNEPNGTSPEEAGRTQYVGKGPQHSIVFPVAQIAYLTVPEVMAAPRANNANGKGFMTDAEISGNLTLRERELKRWEAPTDSAPVQDSNNASAEFDQFQVNEEKFGLKSDYDENHYTTAIDRNNPLYKMRERQAAKIAAEISGDQASAAYMEDRGVRDENHDEEDAFSGVRRNYVPLPTGQPNRYMPPGRRPQVSSKTSAEDPAIISSQVARKQPLADSQISSSDNVLTEIDPKKNNPVLPSTSATSKLAPTATDTVGNDVRAAFKQFANLEKMKVQDSRRVRASQDKAVKVNDLKKFAQNFKLFTPVPKDLVPILSQNEQKQKEIVQKAQATSEAYSAAKTQVLQLPAKSSPAAPADPVPIPNRPSESRAPGAPAANVVSPREGRGGASTGLSQRLENTRRMHRQNFPGQEPNIQQIQDARAGRAPSNGLASPQKPPSMRGSISGPSTRFNVQAIEFKPNAAAMPFKPASVSGAPSGTTALSSPGSRPATRTITPNLPQPVFLREAKARDARGAVVQPITAPFDKAKTLKPLESNAGKKTTSPSPEAARTEELAAPKVLQPFRTPVTWPRNPLILDEDKLPKYADAFQKGRLSRPSAPSSSTFPTNPAAHQHQLPFHLQNGAPHLHQIPAAHQMPPQVHGQLHHFPQGGHFEDHHMRPSPTIPSAYPGPSPRMHSAYPSPMPHGMPMYGQQGYMMPLAQGMPPRQYSNGPAMSGPPGSHMHAPMMTPQASAGGYPQHMMGMPPHGQYPPSQMYQQPNGYPSPGRQAPPMIPSGSHHGHQPPMYVPANQYSHPGYAPHPQAPMISRGGSYNGPPQHFPPSPYQHHQYSHQARRTPSNNYAQTPYQHQMMPNHAGQPASGPLETRDEAK